ncbi:hypothetical protein [Protofrankia coriariae]|uniref:hypothetical protein n=1 Tax=Protofrankia coriariae TaxID=1562887 RepID=UPI0012F6EE93|nr:hypothetical protein [Protofrankia coriariae]
MFVPAERWGWEYVDPGVNPHPQRDHPPVWNEPPPPDTKKHEDDLAQRMRHLPGNLIFPVMLLILSMKYEIFDENKALFWFPIALFLIIIILYRVVGLKRKIDQTKVVWQRNRDAEWERYQAATAGWRAAVESHEAADRTRRETAPLFHPLAPRPTAGRIDVFGGTRDGWASLLATVGSSALASGGGILLLDFSERGVGGGLAQLAVDAGRPVTVDDLPADIGGLGLLHGVDPDDAAELLADAVDVGRGGGADPTLRVLDAEILAVVATRLDPPLTFSRLAAGLRVLEGNEQNDGSDPLSPAERNAVADRAGTWGESEGTRQEIRYLRASLERLAGREETATTAAPQPWWPVHGLRIIATSSHDTSTARKEFVDRVLFHIVLHQLRRRRGDASHDDILVVAGGDRMGLPALEGMARYAANAGIRLVNLFEHLGEGTERLIGAGDSATLVMRLGNAKEAETAAEFVGRGHKFVFSQITRQVGSSLTTGTSSSAGGSVSLSETESRGGSRGKGGKSSGWSRSVTVSQSAFWENTESLSATDSQQDGAVLQRVYEFSVEPTQIQQLPPTAFVLIDSSLGDRRAALGDCNPGIVLLPRVASTARPAVPPVARPGLPSGQGASLPIDGPDVPPVSPTADPEGQLEATDPFRPWSPGNG